jgi:hypothetical protein
MQSAKKIDKLRVRNPQISVILVTPSLDNHIILEFVPLRRQLDLAVRLFQKR